MKNSLNNISQEEKNRILEMHSVKKNVISEQSLEGAVDWAKQKIKSFLPNNSFKASAVVEGDMLMEFPVTNITDFGGAGGVRMEMIDPSDNKKLYVDDFSGPIYEIGTNKRVYTGSSFQNIDMENFNQIAKSQKIPLSRATV